MTTLSLNVRAVRAGRPRRPARNRLRMVWRRTCAIVALVPFAVVALAATVVAAAMAATLLLVALALAAAALVGRVATLAWSRQHMDAPVAAEDAIETTLVNAEDAAEERDRSSRAARR